MINLWNAAESYIQQEQMDRNKRPSQTKTNLENRESHRRRVEAAKRRNVDGYGGNA